MIIDEFLRRTVRSFRNTFGGDNNRAEDSEETVEYPMPRVDDEDGEEENADVAILFQVGNIVNVESRTWPRMNKPGGVGRITSIDMGRRTAAVEYQVVARRTTDDGIPFQFITKYDERRGRRIVGGN